MKLKLTKVNIFLLLFVLFLIISWLGGMLSMYTTSFQSRLTLDKEKKRSVRRFYLEELDLFTDTERGMIPCRQKEYLIITHESVTFHINIEYNTEAMYVFLDKHEVAPNEKVKMTVCIFEKGNGHHFKETIKIITDIEDLCLEVDLCDALF